MQSSAFKIVKDNQASSSRWRLKRDEYDSPVPSFQSGNACWFGIGDEGAQDPNQVFEFGGRINGSWMEDPFPEGGTVLFKNEELRPRKIWIRDWRSRSCRQTAPCRPRYRYIPHTAPPGHVGKERWNSHPHPVSRWNMQSGRWPPSMWRKRIFFSLPLLAMFEKGRGFVGRIMPSSIMPQNLPKITGRQRHLLTLFQPNHFLKPANLLKWNNWKWWDPNLGNPNRTWGWNKEDKKGKRKIFLYRKSIPLGKFNRISWDPKPRTVL